MKSKTPKHARRGPPKTSEGLATQRILGLDRLLKEDAKAGRLDHDPEFRDRILRRGYDALHELVLMSHDPQWPVGVRALAHFKAADHTLQPLTYLEDSDELRAGENQIVVKVAPWAATGGNARRIGAPARDGDPEGAELTAHAIKFAAIGDPNEPHARKRKQRGRL